MIPAEESEASLEKLKATEDQNRPIEGKGKEPYDEVAAKARKEARDDQLREQKKQEATVWGRKGYQDPRDSRLRGDDKRFSKRHNQDSNGRVTGYIRGSDPDGCPSPSSC